MKKLLLVVSIFVLFNSSVFAQDVKLLTQKEAMIRAEITKEVELLYDLNGGHLVNCIEKVVEKPCDSNWVTCIENAWVVKFVVGQACKIQHDGRLGLTFLVNSENGEIISKFPEKEYFLDSQYCLESYDCLKQEEKCMNFIYAPFYSGASVQQDCECIHNVCQGL